MVDAIRYEQQEHFLIGGLTGAGVAGLCVVLAATLLAALLAWRLGRSGTSDRWFWLAVTAVLAILCVYRASGAEHVLTDDLRTIAHGEHWYEARRIPQAIATLGVILATIIIWLLGWRQRDRYRRFSVRVATAALIGLAGLYALRLISLHIVDAILYDGGAVRLNWVLESTLLAMLVGATLARLRES